MLSNASSHCTSRQRTHAKTVLHCPVHMHVTGEIALTPKQAAQASAPSKRPTVTARTLPIYRIYPKVSSQSGKYIFFLNIAQQLSCQHVYLPYLPCMRLPSCCSAEFHCIAHLIRTGYNTTLYDCILYYICTVQPCQNTPLSRQVEQIGASLGTCIWNPIYQGFDNTFGLPRAMQKVSTINCTINLSGRYQLVICK